MAIIGTGASAMQVARTVAAEAASLTIFQRSPQWVVPNPAYHRTVSDEKRWLLTNVPCAIFHIETQVRYAVACLTRMVREGLGSLEPREDVFEDYNARVDAMHQSVVFSHSGMRNWYKNAAGRVVTLSPWRLVEYWSMTRVPDPDDFVAVPALDAVPAGSGTEAGR